MMASTPLRFIATSEPSWLRTVCRLWNLIVPAFFASRLVCSATRLAVPPMWNVRIVNWVPGSPMDCGDNAGGFPDLHELARGQISSVATHAHAASRLAGQHRTNLDA